MAGRIGYAYFGSADSLVATGTSDKTIVQVVAAANHAVKILEFGIWGDSIDLDAKPIPCDFLRQTDAGTMTGGTCTKADDSIADTLDTTFNHTASAEPTEGDILKPFQYHPSSGFHYVSPPGQEVIVGAGDRAGLLVRTPAADHNVNGWIKFEE